MLNKLLILLTIVLACGVLAAQAWAASSRTVALRNFRLDMATPSAPHGAVTFRVTNRSTATNHQFSIKRISTGRVLYRSAILAPGQSVAPTKTLAAGTYQLFCSIHVAIYGMKRNFTVT
ncbi:MAG: hypothetical protein QOJ13_3527 [Gaiellales bacterium]|jgi:hypothetical protein|nr:hypothetical protein [Gaiellales bacterium]